MVVGVAAATGEDGGPKGRHAEPGREAAARPRPTGQGEDGGPKGRHAEPGREAAARPWPTGHGEDGGPKGRHAEPGREAAARPRPTGHTRWWPSPWGEDDQLGMLNHVDDAKRLAALRRVRAGRLYDLGHVLDERCPVFPGRYFRQTLVTTAHHANEAMPVGENRVNWVTEIVSGTMQLGTHLDALSHLQIGDRGYNGWSVCDTADAAGVKKLGVETVPQIVTTGWLVDVSARSLGPGGVIELADLDGIDPEPGDAILFHTGWSRRWDDADAYLEGEPGPGVDVARWLVERGVALTGCDTWSYGPVPAEDPARPFEVPQLLNVHHGVFVVENLDTGELAADGVREFALVLTHPKLRGATGAWTSPVALV